jgi:dienelactone hydrolase
MFVMMGSSVSDSKGRQTMAEYDNASKRRLPVVWTILLIVLMATLAYITFSNQPEVKANLTPADPGPYLAGWKEVTVTPVGSPSFSALLVYPATAAGQNQPFDGSGGPYPALSFGHAFLSQPDYNLETLKHLATHGYIVIAAKSYTGFELNFHALFAADLRHSLTYLEQQNQDNTSPFYHKINSNAFGVFGYSIGGGASILAAADDPRIKVVANMAAAETTPSAADAAARLQVPMRMLAGSADAIAPVTNNQQLIYNKARPPKQLAVLQGGTHCFFNDPGTTGAFCSFIEQPGSMDQATQLSLTRHWLTTWFDYYLKGDQSQEPYVWGAELNADPRVVVQAERWDVALDKKMFLPVIKAP